MKKIFANQLFIKICFTVAFLAIGSFGCRPVKQTATVVIPPAAVTQTTNPIPIPTATEIPVAIRINGEGIYLYDYQSELAQLKSSISELNQTLPEDEIEKMVLEEIIGQTLLAQAAYENGFEISAEELDASYLELSQKAGGEAALQGWMEANGYQNGTLREKIKRQMAASWQRDYMIVQFPDVVPQIHIKQILLYDSATAANAYSRLKSGTDFETLAKFYDPQTGGELGWIPVGYLTQPDVEKAAFELPPGQYSEIIETNIGFHIVMVLERQENRKLTSEARQILLRNFINNWVTEQKGDAVIEISTP